MDAPRGFLFFDLFSLVFPDQFPNRLWPNGKTLKTVNKK